MKKMKNFLNIDVCACFVNNFQRFHVFPEAFEIRLVRGDQFQKSPDGNWQNKIALSLYAFYSTMEKK